MQREYPDRPIVGVGGVIVERDRVLIVRRVAKPLLGEWSVPGGVVELGETLRDAAQREALEETGLEVRADEVLEVFDSIWPGEEGRPQYHYVLVDFLCTVAGGDLSPGSDVSDPRWITREEITTLQLRESIARVLHLGLDRASNPKSR